MAEVNVEVKSQGKAMENMGKILRATLMDDHYMRRFFEDVLRFVGGAHKTV